MTLAVLGSTLAPSAVVAILWLWDEYRAVIRRIDALEAAQAGRVGHADHAVTPAQGERDPDDWIELEEVAEGPVWMPRRRRKENP